MGRWTSWILPVAVVLLVATLAINLVSSDAEANDPATPTPDSAAATPASVPPTPTPEPATPEPTALPTLTPEELEHYRPNELGQIPVLMYHEIADKDGDVWIRKPDDLRADLQWLYDNDFYVIPIRDYVHNQIQAPAGKRPVVLTFDDGVVSHFRYNVGDDGEVTIDPNSAVGILEEFFTRYDDFGRGGLFSILPLAPFAWPDAEDQRPFAQEKLQFLLDSGYELGNHTIGHVNMRDVSTEELKAELAGAVDLVQEYVPEAEVEVIAVTYGIYPEGGDTSVFKGFDYEGRHYEFSGALMVGANPGLSPSHVEFDSYWIPRIRADDEELGKWFAYFEQNPDMIYVSDGNPDTVAIPEDIHPSLADALDDAAVDGKTVIRY